MSASGLIKDVDAYSPGQGVVVVTVMADNATGIIDNAVLDLVRLALNDENVRPVSDKRLIIQPANIIEYHIEAVVYIGAGADGNLVFSKSIERINKYIQDNFVLNRTHSLSGIYDALHEPEVRRVDLISPEADVGR